LKNFKWKLFKKKYFFFFENKLLKMRSEKDKYYLEYYVTEVLLRKEREEKIREKICISLKEYFKEKNIKIS